MNITKHCRQLTNDERLSILASKYYGSGLHRRGADDQQQAGARDNRQSLHFDHGEDDPIPFELDGAWTKVAEITRNTLKQQVTKINKELK